jgi:hypothetical protein
LSGRKKREVGPREGAQKGGLVRQTAASKDLLLYVSVDYDPPEEMESCAYCWQLFNRHTDRLVDAVYAIESYERAHTEGLAAYKEHGGI